MIKPKLRYYNYFLILSMVLIVGYLFTSLFFIKKTSFSGEQVELYGKITEQADAILKAAYKMESNALGFIQTKNEDNYSKYKNAMCNMEYSFNEIKSHCVLYDLAKSHIEKLDILIDERIVNIKKHFSLDSLGNLENLEQITLLEEGDALMDSITIVLNDIRSVSSENRNKNQLMAVTATNNTLFMLSVFGFIMLVIVIISFDKMRKEIRINEQNTLEIAQINTELQSMNKNLENFAYVASHDLKEPLRKIKAFSDLIQEELSKEKFDKTTVDLHLSRMQSASTRMQQLIEDLLSYSRVSSDINKKRNVDLNTIVDVVENDLQLSIKELNAVIETNNLPKSVNVDEIQMQQLFQNLISNALKFHKKGVPPEIHIKASQIEGKTIYDLDPKLDINKKYWKVEVEDNGIGFEEKYREKIFSIFQRLHARHEYLGTGIGLSICKKIVDQHQGFITAKSKVGEGSTFIIYLPIA